MSAPQWLDSTEPQAPEGSAPVAAPTSTPDSTGKSKFGLSNAAKVHSALGLYNLGIASCMAMCSIMTVGNVNSADDTDELFVSFYTLFFAGLLAAYESAKLVSTQWFRSLMRRNFGFFYYTSSRGVFLVFVAFLMFGLNAPGKSHTDGNVSGNWLGIFTGCLMIFEAALIVYLACRYPELMSEFNKEAKQTYTPPAMPASGAPDAGV